MAKWIVTFKDIKKSSTVDADDRWDAVKKAAKDLKLPEGPSMSYYSDMASVLKLERKKRLAWWEK